MKRQWYTVSELAEQSGMTTWAIYHHIRVGNIKTELINRVHHISGADGRKVIDGYQRYGRWPLDPRKGPGA